MENFSKPLYDEHKNILKVVEAMQNECALLRQGKEIDVDFFTTAIDFIRNYADKFHHAKEEDILFKELCKDEVKMHCNPVEQMLYEHNLGRNFVKGLDEGIREKNKEKMIASAEGYANLLREHIWKEDNILYQIAEEALGEEAKKMISEKFSEVEQKFADEIKKQIVFIDKLSSNQMQD